MSFLPLTKHGFDSDKEETTVVLVDRRQALAYTYASIGDRSVLDSEGVTYQAAIDECEKLRLFDRKWRLPTLAELERMRDLSKSWPAAHSRALEAKFHWSSDRALHSGQWGVDFAEGQTQARRADELHYFIAVADAKDFQ